MRFRSIIGTAIAASALVLTGVVTTAGPASAHPGTAHSIVNPTCGLTISPGAPIPGLGGVTFGSGDTISIYANTAAKLKNCTANGINVTGDFGPAGIVLRILGTITANNGIGDNAGVNMIDASRVTVRGPATIRGFDAGVNIDGGTRNVVQNMTLTGNINEGIDINTCELGDGVAILDSTFNQVLGSTITNNGPFSGVSLIGVSTNNLVRSNQITDNAVSGQCVGNLDSGVRIEGPGASFNRIDANNIERNQFSGIAMHENLGALGFGCDRSSGQPGTPGNPGVPAPRTPFNSDNSITNNTIRQNGITTDTLAGGISQFDIGVGDACAATRSTITGNNIAANTGNGLFLAATSFDNTVNNNSFTGNSRDGIRVNGPVFGNTFTNVGPTLFDVTNPNLPPYTEGAANDYRVIPGSGSGNVSAQVVPIDVLIPISGPIDQSTSGCEQSDYTNNPQWSPGLIALVQRGTCSFVQKVNLAIANGAAAVVLFNEGTTGRTSANFGGSPVTTIPVLSTTFAIGDALYQYSLTQAVIANIVTNTTNVQFQAAPGSINNELHNNRGTGNAFHDGHDGNYNPPCDNNDWVGNIFGTVNQACVAANGGTGTVTFPLEP